MDAVPELEETRPVKTHTSIDRREFLGATGVLTGLLAAGSPLALLAPSRAWALDLRALSSAEGAALLAMARTIAPHEKLDDAAYAVVVRALDSGAAGDAGQRVLLRAGLATLGTGFATAPEAERVGALQAQETTPFFKSVRATTLTTLYATPLAYAVFGYEGEAFSKGGYLTRGFNDLRWLPEVPLKDSGPVYTGAAR
ncbi:MAG: twin-arginine translocation signal domain-containing protein [Gammaproteobacteria bacterium]|nr:twin-arginine translocation signal domain-containing protein [Gammaproteobacteria bacterium]